MKRRVLPVVLAAVLGVTAGAAPAAAGSPDEWAQAAGHATGDHYNPGESTLTPAVAARLRPGWTVPMATAKCAEPSGPLVGAGRLITAEAYGISGYDAATGVLKWRTPVHGNRDIDLAVVTGGTLIAQSRQCHSGKASLVALDVRTGATRYTRPVAAPLFGLLADRGILVGGAWDTAASKYVMRGYRIADGAPLWSRDGLVISATVSAGGRMMISGDDGSAIVDITTGKTAWTPGPGCFTPIGASPDGSRFYVRCDPDGPIRTVDAATGKVLTTFPDNGATTGFATDGRRVYLYTFADQGLLAVDATTGRKVWSAAFPDDGPSDFTIAGGVVYGWRVTGKPLAAFAAATGTPIALTTATSALQGPPVVAGGRLYGRTGSTLTAFAP